MHRNSISLQKIISLIGTSHLFLKEIWKKFVCGTNQKWSVRGLYCSTNSTLMSLASFIQVHSIIYSIFYYSILFFSLLVVPPLYLYRGELSSFLQPASPFIFVFAGLYYFNQLSFSTMASVPCMFLIGKMSWGCRGDISNVHSRQYYYIANRIWRVQRDQANSPRSIIFSWLFF